VIKLIGSAGAGKKILDNWNMFNYQFINESSLNEAYFLNFSYSFGSTNGIFVVCLKQNVTKEWCIDINTTLHSNSFQKSLGVYNDCVDFSDGLFKVGYILIKKQGSNFINVDSIKFIDSLSKIDVSKYK
jgi:hypothetical protein